MVAVITCSKNCNKYLETANIESACTLFDDKKEVPKSSLSSMGLVNGKCPVLSDATLVG